MLPCKHCPRHFSHRSSLSRHRRDVHSTETSGGYIYPSKSLSEVNGLLSSLTQKSSICPICFMKFDEGHICPPTFESDSKKSRSLQNGAGVTSADEETDEEADAEADEDAEMDEDDDKARGDDQNYDSLDEGRDIFLEDDEDLTSDASISNSEEEEEEEESEDEDEPKITFIDWPSEKYSLRSRWVRYGHGNIKLKKHENWLQKLMCISNAQILRRIKKSTDSEVMALCEIAANILLGNVYPFKTDIIFLRKNKFLLRAMSGEKVSIERKRSLIHERGAMFIRRLVCIINPLFEGLDSSS